MVRVPIYNTFCSVKLFNQYKSSNFVRKDHLRDCQKSFLLLMLAVLEIPDAPPIIKDVWLIPFSENEVKKFAKPSES